MNDGWMLIGAAVLVPLILRFLVDLVDRPKSDNQSPRVTRGAA
jgi:hypothetical protein